MTDAELIAGLRDLAAVLGKEAFTCAADRIEELLADLARSKRVISKMVPLSADGNHVFWDGVGEIELDHNGKLRAGVEEATKALLEIHRIVPLHPAGDIALATLKKLRRWTMTDEQLIARLRKADEYEPLGHDGWEAADRIEALVKVRREDALELIAAHGQAHDAYEAQLKAEARAERLEAAMTLAANRLQRLAVNHPTGSREFIETSEWADEARAALKGADHD